MKVDCPVFPWNKWNKCVRYLMIEFKGAETGLICFDRHQLTHPSRDITGFCGFTLGGQEEAVLTWCEKLSASYCWWIQATRLKEDPVRVVAFVPWSAGWGWSVREVVDLHTVPGAEGTKIAFPKLG